MPRIKLDHVVSFSSEDPLHIANNILSADPAKKWKCKSPGERSATIIIQLEKASLISSIDIGNENSAYIEVLVTRSSSNEDYKALLVMSSFMTPLEARQQSANNKVRMFIKDQLSKPESEEKWDRVKIVCTQPFNRHIQYGLSFIILNSPGEINNGNNAAPPLKVGGFTVRTSSPEPSIGSLFAKKEHKRESLSAAIREASSKLLPNKPKLKIVPNVSTPSTSTEIKPLPRNRNEILYNKDDEEPNEKIDKIIEKKQSEKRDVEDKVKKTPKRKSDFEDKSPKKKKTIVEEKPKTVLRKPFRELLKGVTLVISGIQNPDRGKLRSLALEMGAKYKADWDDSCTHLICAFANTPKFNQVRGKGKIVTRNWLEECYSKRRRLPWRRYSLDKHDLKKPESEDEILEETPLFENDSTDDEGYDATRMQKRIEELQAKQVEKNEDLFSVDTDEEMELPSQTMEIKKKLPDFFDQKRFFIDESLDKDISMMCERYILAYKGIVAENPFEKINFFITSENNIDSLTDNNSTATCVRPDWLWDCHNSQKLVPISEYLL